MPSSVSVPGASASVSGPAAAAGAQPASIEGWRAGDLPALRAELDRIDNTLHDLLMQRAGIVEFIGRSSKPAAFRPGREASIIRRLLVRHRGALPPASVVRIWRELLAGTTAMQSRFSLAVCDGGHGGLLMQLAREHFGALTPLHAHASAEQALLDVSRGTASVAVLPYPSQTDSWWVVLLHHAPRLHVIGRLPFWKPRPDGVPSAHALVVASTPADASEADRTLLGFDCDATLSRADLSRGLVELGLTQHSLLMTRQAEASSLNVLVEVEGCLGDDDPRLGKLGCVPRRPMVLGCYALPVGDGTQ